MKNTELQLTYSLEETIKRIGDYSHILSEKQQFNRVNGFDYSKNKGGLISEEEINEQKWLDGVQTVLDYAGIIPVVGDALDVINAIISFIRASFEGKWVPHATNGLLSLIAVIPVVGSAIAIPLKSVFKMMPVGALSKIMETIQKGGDAVTSTLKNYKDIFDPVINVINKSTKYIKSGFDILRGLIRAIAIIPFTKIDDVLSKEGIKLLNRLEKFILGLGKKTSTKSGAKSVASKLIKQIPSNKLTKQGRILLPAGSRLFKKNRQRAFYATQDMFKNHLVKEMTNGPLSKNLNLNSILYEASKNLNIKGKNVLSTNKELQREFANLVMVNGHKSFDDFLKGSSFKQRTERFLRTVDPSVVKDTRGFFSYLKKSGASFITATTLKDYKSDEEYSRDKDIEILDKKKSKYKPTHDMVGKKRKM
jgi:hypothetical protein